MSDVGKNYFENVLPFKILNAKLQECKIQMNKKNKHISVNRKC